ncbi:MAG: hypothetical protein J6M06_00165, partial [Synergistaceae bacterium]|nr:hypothetical protein [Synergistaceae bacterium]
MAALRSCPAAARAPSGDHGRPVVLGIDVGKAVGRVCAGRVDIDVADLRVVVVRPRRAEKKAVPIFSVVAVVVADKLDAVAVLQSGRAFGDGFRLPAGVDAARAGDLAVGAVAVEGEQQLRALTVQKAGHVTGDRVAAAVVVDVGKMVVG